MLSRISSSFRGTRQLPLWWSMRGGESLLRRFPSARTSSSSFSKQAALNEKQQQQQEQRKEEETEARQRSKRLTTTTMDEFFEHLGATTGEGKKGKPSAKRPRIVLGTKQKSNETSTTPPSSTIQTTTQGRFTIFDASSSSSSRKVAPSRQLADMNSFFDEVNKVVAQNKKKETVAAQESSLETSSCSSSSLPSILDLMPPVREGPSAFEEQSYDDYIDLVDMVMADPYLFRKKSVARLDQGQVDSVFDWLRAEERMVDYQFPSLDQVLTAASNNNWDEETLRKDLRGEINAQKEKFQTNMGWNNTQYELATRALHRIGNLCAKKASGPPGEVAWEKMKEAGFCLQRDIVQNYLYVISTFSTSSYSTFSTKGSVLDFLDHKTKGDENKRVVEEEPLQQEEVANDIATEVALLHDILFGASEESTTIRVRKLVWERRPAEAEALLDNNANDELRLRTYDPVFRCYLDNKDVSAALKLYVKMKSGESVHLKPETYIQLMSAIAENGYFRPDSPPIDGALVLGYEQPSGPKLFDRLAEELANDAVEISASAAKRLYNGLLNGFSGHNLKPLHLLQSLVVCNDPANPMELVASRVALDETTGQCPRTGVHLRLINLDVVQKKRLRDGLQFLAKSAYEERTGKDGSPAEKHLEDFGIWLAEREQQAFTAIIDGANVGYYFQNFDEGRFNYNQIEFVVDTLERMGENVLVTIPKKYTQDTFTVQKSTGPQRQNLTTKERQIRDRLQSTGKLLIVPPSYLDDYYWMYASVAGQGDKFTVDQQYIQPNNADERWPGIRPMLISNDKMRDHKLSLLEPRLFRRWYSNFLVNYTFSAFVGDKCPEKDIGFRTADFYSREIQGNQVSKAGTDCGIAWHFPVRDWEENESFCVRIPH